MATIVKLIRVTLLPVVVLLVVLPLGRTGGTSSGLFPGFVIAFLAFAAINSFGIIPIIAVDTLSEISRWSLVTAIAAIGVKTNLGAITQVGIGLVGLVVAETVFLLIVAVGLVYSGLLPIHP